ncbi:ribose transport system substrate-binding protein [Thermocatellispora tengchongensis]|uniref:Ribose transport system substrate-binding protein n=1 Tax=Thermocatellispora tengchongensis TaxID=1073253 RepID=A0A840P510_9ACTN|nr:sugar ABC transporter substrate-binding protein [Thermocatellispora tengchongensis]MBB5132951.1 ribose transport system substrate-binding protein [Thermocatellispora tengchongensis]
MSIRDRYGRGLAAGIMAAGLLALSAACVAPGSETGGTTGATAEGAPSASAGGHKRIAFFGFARANSFAAATWAGIEEYAKANDAEAEFFDPNFDAQTQVQQIQDAVTSKRFDVFIVQANDGAAVVPAVRQAVAAGITVVAEFTPVGTRYDTTESQVPGMLTLLDVPTDNGRKLGELGVAACQSKKLNPCKVAYLEGFKSLPLDNARTDAAVKALEAAPGVELVARVEGGYTKESGRKAMQDVLQSQPDVNVVIGSSQAIAGAEGVAGGKDVLFVGNGGSRQAVRAVQEGRWFATYYLPEKTAGAKAAELGLAKARGQDVTAANSSTDLAPNGGLGTKDALKDVQGEYDE